jgi:DNA (cytosine-5)-methyltransferase 1
MKKLRVLDLFSGIGGFSLGLERTGGFETAAFCEYAEFPRKVLKKHWPDVPIYPDIRELTAERLDADGIGRIDILTGGYPCQPFSHAGKRLGAEDDRHLWPEMRRLVESLRPAWVIGENVAGHVSMGLDSVLSDLGGLGYAAQAFVIPACAVNAPHRRDRLWIVAHAVRARPPFGNLFPGICRKEQRLEEGQTVELGCEARQRENVAHLDRFGLSGSGQPVASINPAAATLGQTIELVDGRFRDQWSVEPDVGRVAHGVPNRVDRIKALGNAVVPQIPEMIGHAILRSMRAA